MNKRNSPEEHEICLKYVSKVIVSINGSVWIIGNVSEHLHTNDGVDEEQHDHQHHNIRQGLQKKEFFIDICR